MKITLQVFFIFFCISVYAQIESISVGSNYMNQTFYSLKDGVTQSNPHTIWDIAFDISPQGASVLLNEAVGLSFGPPLSGVELYVNDSNDFENADTTGITRIYNTEVSWADGAFNSVSTGSPLDLGWGTYNTTTHTIEGSRLFFIKLRNATFKKLEIQSLAGRVYTFRYADLDGSNETTQSISKADYSGKTLAYFSVENNEVLDLEPAQWDLVFTRYSTVLDDGEGGKLDYMVTGILQNKGVLVAQINNVGPTTVNPKNYEDKFQDTIDIIGHDWKYYDFQSGWGITANQVFFVKIANDSSLWKVQFLDFEGGSTGNTTLEKTPVTLLTATNSLYKAIERFSVYPNPATSSINVAFELETKNRDAILELYNSLAQNVLSKNISINQGLNVIQIPISLPTGVYSLTLRVGNEIISKPVLIE